MLRLGRAGFNRTFMELKYVCFCFVCHKLISFNRTFMELKCQLHKKNLSRTSVSIVPLWN